MRRSRSVPSVRCSLVALLALGAVSASACGVTADTTAATVHGQSISIDDVNAIVDEPAIVGPLPQGEATSDAAPDPEDLAESRQSGDVARAALAYEIRRVTWVEEAKRWKADPTAQEQQAAEAELDQQLAQAQVTLSDSTRPGAVDFAAHQQALLRRFADIDPSNEDDLRLVYEGSTERWTTWCLTVVGVGSGDVGRVERLMDRGRSAEQIAERVDGVQVLAVPDECLTVSDLPPELARAISTAGRDDRPDTVTTASQTGEVSLVTRIERVVRRSYAEARPDVERTAASLSEAVQQLAALNQLDPNSDQETLQQAQVVAQQAGAILQGWIDVLMLDAEINPRYGSGVATESSQSGTMLVVVPPPAPEAPMTGLVDLSQGLPAGDGTGTAGTASAGTATGTSADTGN